MSRSHGKLTEIALSGASLPVTGYIDISEHIQTSEFTRSADALETTTYGKDSRTYAAGLKNGTFTMSGLYDTSTTTGPRAVLKAAIGSESTVTLRRRTEGTGTGKPQDLVAVVFTSYVETNPFAEQVAWSAEANLSDDVDVTAQS